MNERVLLPGVGEFVLECIPASFNEDGLSILPPGKKLIFVQGNFEGECEPWQVELSGRIKEGLQQNGVFEVPGLGVFASNGIEEIIFTIDKEFDFAPDSFSLEAIRLEANEPEVAVEEVPEMEKQALRSETGQQQVAEPVQVPQMHTVKKSQDVPQSMEQKRKIQKWILWTAVVVILLLVLVLFIVLFKEDFMELLKQILYTEEELEIMQKWAAQ